MFFKNLTLIYYYGIYGEFFLHFGRTFIWIMMTGILCKNFFNTALEISSKSSRKHVGMKVVNPSVKE